MEKISVVTPRYNEEESAEPMVEALVGFFRHRLAAYDYELVLINNDSQDRIREHLRVLCAENHRIKAIFNAKNFEQFNSPYYGMLQSIGDATVLTTVDFQGPSEMTVKYVVAWGKGYKVAIDIKTRNAKNPLMYHLHSLYYRWTRRLSRVDQIEYFTDFGLYGKSFIQVLRDLDDPTPFLRDIIAELGYRRKEIPYDQLERRTDKTSDNPYKLYDAAMFSVIFHTKFDLCPATFPGSITLVVNVVIVLIYLVMKLPYWDCFQARLTPLLIDVLFLGAMQIFLIDMAGEYVLTINQHVIERPLVVEAERLNFESEDTEEMR